MRGLPRPITLVKIAMGGFALAAATYFVAFLPIPTMPVHGHGFWADIWSLRLRFLAVVLPGAVGLACGFWAERRFRRGFLDDVWGEGELAPVRSFLDSSFWTWMALLFAAVIVVGIVVHLQTHRNGGLLWYVLLLPTQALARLRQIVRPRAVNRSGLVDWQNYKPIRSEHWGEGRT